MKLHDSISPKLADWVAKQKMFFVGSAPISENGHVNLSPKGGDAFRLLGPNEAAYQDYTGSGAETIAHLQENGRIVIMFCAFEGPPQILRFHGKGTVHTQSSNRFEELAANFPAHPGTRSIIHIEITRIADSCGWSVPFYEYTGNRDTLDKWSEQKGPEGIAAYHTEKNSVSIDGLQGVRK